MIRSFDHLRILLGMPVYRSVTGGECDARVSAHWNCGCVAIGATFAKMALTTCRAHQAGPVDAPALVS